MTVGIGRELYSAPFIWVSAQKCHLQRKNDKWICYDKFAVTDISYSESREITGLTIVNQESGEVVYSMFPNNKRNNSQFSEFYFELDRTGVSLDTVLSRYGVNSLEEMKPDLLNKALNSLRKTKTKSA